MSTPSSVGSVPFWIMLKRRRPVTRFIRWVVTRPNESVAGLVLAILLIGSLFYHVVEGWNLLDSLYFCVITLTTIGYGDFSPKTDPGKLFTIMYAFTGIGLLATYLQLRAQQRIERNRQVAEAKAQAQAKAGASAPDAVPPAGEPPA